MVPKTGSFESSCGAKTARSTKKMMMANPITPIFDFRYSLALLITPLNGDALLISNWTT